MRVYIFGDSITQGYFDTQSGGWVNRLAVGYFQEKAAEPDKEWLSIFPLGIAGDTAAGVLDRIEDEVEARRLFEQEECIVLAIGMNDTKLVENLPVVEEYAFQKTYEELIDTALSLCPRVICVGLSSVDEAVVNAAGAESFHNNRINLFEDIIKQSAIRKEVAFVPIHDAFLAAAAETELLAADGLHPNAAGHAFIAKEVQAAIEALR